MQITQMKPNLQNHLHYSNDEGVGSWWLIILDDIELETHEYLEDRVFVGLYKLEPGDGMSNKSDGFYSDPVVFNASTGKSVNFDDLYFEFAYEVEDYQKTHRCTNWVIKKCHNEISKEDHEQNLIDNPMLKNNPFGLDPEDHSKFGVKELCMDCAVSEGMSSVKS